MPTLTRFRFWCQSVLPLVYDDSLSYYEVLCRVVDYINGLIDTDNKMIEDIDALKAEMTELEKWMNNHDKEFVEKIVREYLATMIFVEINSSGYFVFYIPDSWSSIHFHTTGYDIELEEMPEFGHLVLDY